MATSAAASVRSSALGVQAELVVQRHLARLEAEQPRGSLDRRVRLLRANDDAAAVRRPRGGEGSDRRDGSRVLDVAVPPGREAEELGDPVEREGLELGGRRRRAPDERDRVERGGEKLREDARLGGAVGEVGEEPRALPVRRSRQQDLVEVAQHVCERLASLRRRRRQATANVARLDLREHGELADLLEVPRSPLERGGSVLAKGHFRSFSICGHVRVFSTWSFVSQARRACATPISMCWSALS